MSNEFELTLYRFDLTYYENDVTRDKFDLQKV